MNSGESRRVSGHWVAGEHAGRAGTVLDVRAGWVYGVLSDGAPVSGAPQDFQADSGARGEGLLDSLLPRPDAAGFFAGMIRESLAAVYSAAVFGQQDTRAWERPYRYIVDDGEGNAAVVQLSEWGPIGAVAYHDPTRDLGRAMEAVPEPQRHILRALLDLPFLNSSGATVSAVFWTANQRLISSEPWFRTYHFGGEILRRELLDETGWRRESAEHHGMDTTVVDTILAISRRAIPLHSVCLTNEELGLLLPSGAPHIVEAMKQLTEGEVFTVA